MKIALFDFCETVVKFQTADKFVHFVRNRSNNYRMNFINKIHSIFIKFRIIAVLEHFFPKSSLNKRLVLFQLKGFSKSRLRQYAKLYYFNKIKKAFIKTILFELIKKKEEGYKIIVVSGGYDIYLDYFVEEFRIDGLISTQIKFNKSDICMGKISGIDCLWSNKVKLLESYFVKEKIDFRNSLAYSDSFTDIPMLNWVQNGIVVSNNNVEKWMKKYKIILWE
tara:strand:+ start:729 stop:1394 length:666 start_codon:yes stop_codon:yes gene_type:complete